jgi:hypothetical protein
MSLHLDDTAGLTLAFIGEANWDLWVGKCGNLTAIPKPEITGCKSSGFGDKHHIKRLMHKGYFNDVATEVGLELLSGLHNRLITPERGKPFAILSF